MNREILNEATEQPAAPVRAPAGLFRSTGSRAWLLGVVLLAATVLAYKPAWNAGFIWDDDVYVTDNELLTAPDGLKRIWFSLDSPSQYFPLTYTTFLIERRFWGLNPAGYHWVNILLHAANALLLWRLLHRLNVPGSWLAAAVFALHPVHVESVAWITERKNVLSLFFMLLSTAAWVKFIRSHQDGRSQAARAISGWWFYVLALLFYALALFSKTTACVLPAVFLLIWWWKKKPNAGAGLSNNRLRLRLAQVFPFVVLGLGMGLLAMWWERYHQLALGKTFELGLLDRVLIAGRAVWFYAGKLAWPADLVFSYPRWTIDPGAPGACGWLVAAGAVVAATRYARRYVGRSPEVAVLFFVLTLSPMLGFIMLYTFAYTFVADHYQYVASIGLIALGAAALAGMAQWWRQRLPRFTRPGLTGVPALLPLAVSAVLLAMLGLLTSRQAALYANSETLWRATLARNPQSLLAHVNLGSELSERGEVDEAMEHFRMALAIQPDDAVAGYSLGNALLKKGRLEDALVRFRRAAAADPRDPVAQYDLGVGLFQQGQLPGAIECYQKAIALQPKYAQARFNLGIAYYQSGRPDDALVQFQQVVNARPGFVDARYNLAMTLSTKGRLREAMEQFEAILRLQPHHVSALNNLAWVLATCPDASLRNGARAVTLAEYAVRVAGPDEPSILDTLAAAYAETERYPEAVAAANRALAVARSRSDGALVDALRSRIALYEAQAPYRDGSPGNPAGP